MAKIFIYGEIGWDVTAKDILTEINAISDNEVDVHFNSPGGSVTEGFAIKNILVNSGKKLRHIADGMVGSICTVPFLASETRLMNENTKFFIHNPWTVASGDSADMRKAADSLDEAENEILDFYIGRTGANREEIQKLMKEETSLTPERAVELGFATEIIQPVYALAYFDRKTAKQNSMKEFNEEGLINKIVSGVKNAINPIKGLKLATLTGEVMDISTNENDISVGDAVKINGSAPENGPVKMVDGRTLTIEAGRIASIEEAPELVALEQVENMLEKAVEKVSILFKEENDKLKAVIKDQADQIKSQSDELEKVKGEITSGYTPPKDETITGAFDTGEDFITKEDLVLSATARAKKMGLIKNTRK